MLLRRMVQTMNTQDDYRKNAAEAQRQADRTASLVDREAWLRVAQGWLSLLKKPPQTLEETFDEALADKGTRAGRYEVPELRPPHLPQFVIFFVN